MFKKKVCNFMIYLPRNFCKVLLCDALVLKICSFKNIDYHDLLEIFYGFVKVHMSDKPTMIILRILHKVGIFEKKIFILELHMSCKCFHYEKAYAEAV